MNAKNAAELYQRASVENAPPLQILRMLYQGLLRFLKQAEQAGPEAKAFDDDLQSADAILTELRRSLDHSVAPELAEELDSLYVFCELQIAQAMIQRDPAVVANARGVLERLLEGWNAIDLTGAGAGEGAASA